MSLNLSLSDVFLMTGVLGFGGRNSTKVEHPPHPIMSRVHALIELSTDMANLHLLARPVFARFAHWSVIFLPPSTLCYLETSHQVQPILKGVGMELSSTSCSGWSIYIYKENLPLLPCIFNTVIYLYHCGLICLFYTLGYKPILCYLVAEIVPALVGALSA